MPQNIKLLIDKFPEVKPYIQHGFIPLEKRDKQIIGDCPFCGKEKKFFVNKDSKAWDCKVCKAHGGFQTFLIRMMEQNQENFANNADAKKSIEKSRKIPSSELLNVGMGYSYLTKSFTLPIWNLEGNALADLRIFNNGRLMSTSTCKTSLYMAHEIKPHGRIYICEGEWDAIALKSKFKKFIDSNFSVVAVPGSEVFKPNWINLFSGREVIALYDNDEAGKKGSHRAHGIIKDVVKSIKFLHWPEGTIDKYDIRDLCSEEKDARKVLAFIESHLRDEPPFCASVAAKTTAEIEVYDGEGLPAEEVRERYLKWLHMPDTDVLDVVYGTIIANRLMGDPLWLNLVAPPGMMKSSILGAFGTAKGIETITTMTPKTLLSGTNKTDGSDPSLINRLGGKVLIIKDLTTMLSMNDKDQKEIFGLLRDAYDGEIKKTYGNGLIRHYEKRFGIIAGVTPVIETMMNDSASLGERFLRWNEVVPDSIEGHLEYVRRAASNVTQEDVMKQELQDTAMLCLDYPFVNNVVVDDEIEDKVLKMAIICSMARGTVPRDAYTKEIIAKAFFEMGTRLTKQFLKLLFGICMFRRTINATNEELRIIRKVAQFSAGNGRMDLLKIIYKKFKTNEFNLPEIVDIIGLPSTIVRRHLESLLHLSILDKNHKGMETTWKLELTMYNLIKESTIFS